jgi:glycosyltransferase involved in cell wall biosynthesis
MRVLFLNQYFPPDPAPTGVLLRELADSLEARGWTVDFVAARQDYRAGQRKGRRIVRELKGLATMLLDGLRRPRPDLVVSASSPPALAVVASIVALRHRARSIHWIMDLYPEIAVALGEVPRGLLANSVERAMKWAYRRCQHVVVLDADMAGQLERYGISAKIIRPWVFSSVLPLIPNSAVPEEPWTWIYSGNLGRAHEWKTLLDAQALLERREVDARLLFQGGGPSWPAAQAYAAELGLRRCEWKSYVPEEELPASLARCHVCAVTQLPATQGLLWPSKLGLVMTLGRPILWVGPLNGAIAQELRTHPNVGTFAPGDASGVSAWLTEQRDSSGSAADPASAAVRFDAAAHREQALREWNTLVSVS